MHRLQQHLADTGSLEGVNVSLSKQEQIEPTK